MRRILRWPTLDDLRRPADLALSYPAWLALSLRRSLRCRRDRGRARTAALGFHEGQQLWYWDPVDQAVCRRRGNARLHRCTIRYVRLAIAALGNPHRDSQRGTAGRRSGWIRLRLCRWHRSIPAGQSAVQTRSWLSAGRTIRIAGRVSCTGRDGRATGRSASSGPQCSIHGERVDALERGEVHCIHGPDYDDVARLEADPAIPGRAVQPGLERLPGAELGPY